jgi:hypothetical protein
MTEDAPAAPGQPGFVRGNERLDQLLANPQLAADVAAAHTDAEEMMSRPVTGQDNPILKRMISGA